MPPLIGLSTFNQGISDVQSNASEIASPDRGRNLLVPLPRRHGSKLEVGSAVLMGRVTGG